MDSHLGKCFICDVECSVDDRNVGINIARRLTMPIASVLTKCLRTVVDTENEYFCAECVIKIEDYDQLIQLSLQIETELYELYQRKLTTDSCYLLDAEIIVEPDAMNDELIKPEKMKLENETILSEPSTEEFNETFDGMVVEYLDDYETQSDDVNLAEDQEETVAAIEESNENSSEPTIEQSTTPKMPTSRPKRKKGSIKQGVTTKTKMKPKTEPSSESPSEQSTENNTKCHLCSFVGENRLELEEHKTIKHIDEIKRLVCDICGRTYKSKSALCVHLGMHNGRNSHGK